jgi:hypothetical protein
MARGQRCLSPSFSETSSVCAGQVLVDKSAPGLALIVAENNSEVIGNACDGAPVGIAKGVPYRLVGSFGRPAPHVAMLIAQTDVIAVAVPVKLRRRPVFFKTEEAARHLAMLSLLFEDAARDHQLHYQSCELD